MSGYTCQTLGCGNRIEGDVTPALETTARVAGWAVWRGTTRGGVMCSAVHCPTHNGHASEAAAEPAETGWDADCDTCMVNAATDDPGFDGTEEAAEEWMEEHVCESHVNIIRPRKPKAMVA